MIYTHNTTVINRPDDDLNINCLLIDVTADHFWDYLAANRNLT